MYDYLEPEATEAQLDYLRLLGCTEEPETVEEACDLIEEWKGRRDAARREERRIRQKNYKPDPLLAAVRVKRAAATREPGC